ncbi:hypothetical protein AVEN_204261-1 [Araneus ventricosus]|uniref:Reverse transcriptase domain-containing protein n=1 Tax=Araneus ventricosus TaxID=182803 RepID=A0A4Y2WHK8_ARAVE|nr:hypothetical protein AVEN_80342-1 [Araneus ventricosus]GBO36144.1 hypothetical protein AVEN_204261-1 [Araneus ventricosus]
MLVVYIDFKGAYDYVWRENLYQKLLRFCITSNLFNWIRSFTSQRTCRDKFGDSFSKSFNLQTGLPQGAVYSCTLFNIDINDLLSTLKSISGVKCLLFDDDVVIWNQTPKLCSKDLIESRLNKALRVLSDWSDENTMTVNLQKSASQSFSLTHETFRPELQYQNTSIANTDSFTYLGTPRQGKRIVLQWVPAYCSLWDKEQANFLAKKCANLLQHPNAATSYWKIKLFLNNLCISNSLRDLQICAALKSWRRFSPSSIPDKPRRDAVAALRLTTGHDCLAAHLHLLGISTEPFCPLCDSGEVMERNHLLRCGALQGLTEMSTYWEARALLGQ